MEKRSTFRLSSWTSTTPTIHNTDIWTLDRLSTFDGQNDQAAYIAVNGTIYDVSQYSVWFDGSHKGYRAGQDLTTAFSKSPHSMSLLNNAPIIGTLDGSVPTAPLPNTSGDYDDDDDESDDFDKEEESYEVKLPSEEDLLIPGVVKSFPAYFIFSQFNAVLQSKNQLGISDDVLINHFSDLIISDKPSVVQIEGDRTRYFLVAKEYIEVEGIEEAYYVVINEVTMAYQVMDNLMIILVISFIVGTLISLVVGYLISGRTIKPIKEAYLLKQEFVGNASHELRTPLSVIMLSCDVLDKAIIKPDDLTKQTVSDIREESNRMGALVQKLLFLARNDIRQFQLKMDSLDLSNLIQKVLKTYKYAGDSKSIQFKNLIQSPLMTSGDEEMLNSVFSILIDNAIKYSDEDGLVTISAVESKKNFEIQISDTGQGITKKELQRVFDRFYRVDVSRSRTKEGHGLGLSIAKEILIKHQGDLTAESTLGVGTTFIVKLPH